MTSGSSIEVLVVGGGNAALCAALSASARGARVLLLESAPKAFRGGNSRHTRNLRCMHEGPSDVLSGVYSEDEYWRDLVHVTGGRTDEPLARSIIRGTADCRSWMMAHGVRFQPPLTGTLHLSRTNAFFLGGGKALMNAYYRSAERHGIEIIYDAEVDGLQIDDGAGASVRVRRAGRSERIHARTLIIAAGGFQANLAWLREIWGPPADNFLIRGTPYDTGLVLRALLDAGVKSAGDPTQCHAVAIDARAPKFDGGIVTRVDCVTLGVVVNERAERFYDEGEDFWPKRYAIWGRLVAQQPEQRAYVIIDAKAAGMFIPPFHPPITAPSIRALAAALLLDPDRLEATIAAFNDGVRPGSFDHTVLDGCRTEGVSPPKSHWARRLDTPPFHAYPLRPGITFTYLGVAVDARARVLREDGSPIEHIFAAGEIMSGNVLGQGYLAGFGMAIGTVVGRLAGEEAAAHARR